MTAALAVLAGLVTAAGVAPPAAAAISPGQTLRVSVHGDGSQSQQPSLHPAVSGDGRWVVFASLDALDTSAQPDTTPTPQIFVRDLVNNTTRLLSLTYSGEGINTVAEPADGTSDYPAISVDGRFVAFHTNAPLVSGDDVHKIILVDRDPDGDGNLDEPIGSTILLGFSLMSDDDEFPDPAYNPSISVSAENGIQVAFEEQPDGPSRLVLAKANPTITPGRYTAAGRVVRPQQTGKDLSDAWSPAISADGRRVVAEAEYVPPQPEPVPILLDPAPTVPASASAAAQAPPPEERVVAFDVGAISSTGDVPAVRVDVFTELIAHQGGNRPLISGDGRKVVFEVSVVPAGSEFPTEPRAFIADLDGNADAAMDAVPAVDVLSRDNDGNPVRAVEPAISADGRYAAFVTDAPNTHNGVDQPQGSNCANPRLPSLTFATAAAQVQSTCQVVVRDLILDERRADNGDPRLPGELATPSVDSTCPGFDPGETCAFDGIAEVPALAGDGSVVAYQTGAQDLLAGDDNGEKDVYARRFTPIATATPTPVDFGGVQVGDTVNTGTVITAVGFGPLKIQSVAVTGTGFTLGTQTCVPRGPLYQLDPASNCAVAVDFAPAEEGARSATVDLTPAFGDVVHIPVNGVGTPFPQPDPAFQVQPSPLNFGERLIFTDSSAAVVTVTNAGTRPLTIAAVSLPPLLAPSAPGDYRITANSCAGAVLTAGASCAVTLVHQPQGPGNRPAVLQFDQQTPGALQPHLVQLLGAGTTPGIQINPAVVPVGRVTTVVGTGFPPGRVASVRMPGFPELVQVTPDATGQFARALLIFPNAVAGNRTVQVTVDGTSPAIGDAENLLVVPGTIGPPDFLVRR